MEGSRSEGTRQSADFRTETDDDLSDPKDSKNEQKIYKAIQRVHRACNACRKQKARCEGPEDPPCRRCRQMRIDCIFEKPPKERDIAPTDSDAGSGADRIKTLESQMLGMQSMLGELVASIKANTQAITSSPAVVTSLQPEMQPLHASIFRHDAGPTRHRSVPDAPMSSQAHPYYRNMQADPSPAADGLARYQAEPAAPHRRPQFSPASSSYSRVDAPPLQLTPSHLLPQSTIHESLSASNIASQAGEEASYNPRNVTWNASRDSSRSGMQGHHQSHLDQRSPDGPSWTASPAPKRQWSSTADRPFEHHFSPADADTIRPHMSGSSTAGTVDYRKKLTPDSSTYLDHAREADIPNEQLTAPIEALRGLADAAAAAAEEDEADLSGSPSPKLHPAKSAAHQGQQTSSATTANIDVETSSLNATAATTKSEPSESDPSSAPNKKRRRDMEGTSSNAMDANTVSATQKGGNETVTATAASVASKGKMEAPEMTKNSAGDLVTLGLVTTSDALRLFGVFQKGVPKFISIFHLEDEAMTTEDAYQHVRSSSYFLFNVMIAIGAKVECGGRPPSRLYQTCMAQAKRNAKDTMFSPVAGKEAVQAMVLLAAYSENGWLTLGLSIRMAQELGLDRSFQKLMSALPSSGYIKHPQPPPPPKHLTFYHASPQSSHYTGSPTDVASAGDADSVDARGQQHHRSAVMKGAGSAEGNLEELKDLARGARLWFFLFLFDHQASYGAGRPAMLSKHYVRNCRAFLELQYPLTVKTDARFISTLELLIIRETHYDAMAPYDRPVDSHMLRRMRKVSEELAEWHQYWSSDFERRGYGQNSFFQQSLVLQCASAELYLTCTALRGIRDASDADHMGPEQKDLIIQATRAADTCLTVSVNSKEYREMLGWAPHYTHVTAAFACVFLIKIARLFPRQVDTYGIFSNAERLASRLAEVPATKYARVIRILLAQAWKKITELSPAIGLYAALGAEATRPGAITPAEIKTGGPSDSGISLLYKLLQEHQHVQQPSGSSADLATMLKEPLDVQSNWLMPGASPSFAAGGGTMSPRKPGSMLAISGAVPHADGSTADGIPWGNFFTAQTPGGSDAGAEHQPLQLPIWMQESTGAFVEADDPGAVDGRSGLHAENGLHHWGHQDQYQSPVPQSDSSPAFQTPQHRLSTPLRHQPSQTHYLGPQLHTGSQQQPWNARSSQANIGVTSGLHTSANGFVPTTNFDDVLNDLGLPLDGLDGLFVDLPIDAPTGRSIHSV